MTRGLLRKAALSAALLAVGWSLWWGLLAYRLTGALDQGGLTAASYRLAGFPAVVRLELGQPALAGVWRGERLALSLSPLHPRRLMLDGDGRQWFGGPDPAVTVERWSASLHGNRLEVAADGLLLPDDPRLPLDRRIEHLRLAAEIKGWPAPNLSAWRRDGGLVELRTIFLDWPPLRFDGEGTLALDKRLQPLFAGTAKAGGLFETLDRLGDKGMVRRQDALLLRAALTMLAKPGADGRAEIQLPVTVQDGALWLGPVAAMTLPEIVWPDSVFFRNE